MSKKGKARDNDLSALIAGNAEQISHAFAVRSICFMEERGLSYNEEFDQNDFRCSHALLYAGDEPIATCRIRWFSGFVRLEKFSMRRDYRHPRIMLRFSRFIDAHVAQKGYTTVTTVAEERYAQVWERGGFGFQRVPGRTASKPGQEKVYFEMIKHLEPSGNVVNLESDISTLFRMEGSWQDPAAFG